MKQLVRIISLDEYNCWKIHGPDNYINKLMVKERRGYSFANEEDEFLGDPFPRNFLDNYPGFKAEILPEL